MQLPRFDTQFLDINAKLLVFDTKFISFTHARRPVDGLGRLVNEIIPAPGHISSTRT